MSEVKAQRHVTKRARDVGIRSPESLTGDAHVLSLTNVNSHFDLRMWCLPTSLPDISALILLYPTSACYIMLDQPLLLYPP